MAQLFKNNAFSFLAGALTNSSTTLTVVTSHGDRFPAVTAPDFAMVTLQDAANNIEIVKVTARTAGADSMTIQRAQEGTTARAWSIGDIVELRVTAFSLNPLALLAGASSAAAIRALLDVPSRAGGDTTGTWSLSISGNADNITGVAAAANGGTGFSSYAVGDILFASGAAALSKLAAVAVGNVLLSGGVATAPAWGKVGLTTHVTGVLGVPNGGTGVATLTGLAFGNGTGAFSAATASLSVGFPAARLKTAAQVNSWRRKVAGRFRRPERAAAQSF